LNLKNKKFTEQDLSLLLKKVSIYRKGYNIETKNKKWVHTDRYLSNKLLINTINSSRKERTHIAFSSCYMTNFFVLDLDYHCFYGADYFKLKKIFINQKYDLIKKILGEASLACCTPRGVHLYYFLKEKVCVDNLHSWLSEKLKQFDCIDIKPGVDSYIRSLAKLKLLNTKNLKIYRSTTKFSTIINKATSYNVEELFHKEIHKKKNKISKTFKELKDFSVINVHETNDALNYLIPLWKNHGFNDEECANLFISRLSSSYSGECRCVDRLLQRIHCYNKTKTNTFTTSYDKIYKEHKDCIDKTIKISNLLIKNSNNRKIRAENIKKIMCTIFSVQDKSNFIKKDKRILYQHCTNNPYFYYESVINNRIAIASTIFKSCVKNYQSILKFLKSINFITSQSTYSILQSSCIYYSINEDFYIKSKSIKSISNIKSLKVMYSFLPLPNICSNMFLVSFMKRGNFYPKRLNNSS